MQRAAQTRSALGFVVLELVVGQVQVGQLLEVADRRVDARVEEAVVVCKRPRRPSVFRVQHGASVRGHGRRGALFRTGDEGDEPGGLEDDLGEGDKAVVGDVEPLQRPHLACSARHCASAVG